MMDVNITNKRESNNRFRKTADTAGTQFASFIGVDLHKCIVTLKAVDPDEELINSLTIDTKCVKKIEHCRDKFAKKPSRYLGKRRHRKLPPRMKPPINGTKGFHPYSASVASRPH